MTSKRSEELQASRPVGRPHREPLDCTAHQHCMGQHASSISTSATQEVPRPPLLSERRLCLRTHGRKGENYPKGPDTSDTSAKEESELLWTPSSSPFLMCRVSAPFPRSPPHCLDGTSSVICTTHPYCIFYPVPLKCILQMLQASF